MKQDIGNLKHTAGASMLRNFYRGSNTPDWA